MAGCMHYRMYRCHWNMCCEHGGCNKHYCRDHMAMDHFHHHHHNNHHHDHHESYHHLQMACVNCIHEWEHARKRARKKTCLCNIINFVIFLSIILIIWN